MDILYNENDLQTDKHRRQIDQKREKYRDTVDRNNVPIHTLYNKPQIRGTCCRQIQLIWRHIDKEEEEVKEEELNAKNIPIFVLFISNWGNF